MPPLFTITQDELAQILRQRQLVKQNYDWLLLDLKQRVILDYGRLHRECLTLGENNTKLEVQVTDGAD